MTLSFTEIAALGLGWPVLVLFLLVHRRTRIALSTWRQACIDQRHKAVNTEMELRNRNQKLVDRITKTETPPIVPAQGYAPQCLTCHRPVKFDEVSMFVCPDCMEKNLQNLTGQ